MARPSGRPIRDELLIEARDLIQRVGVNGFSYGDLATRLDIKSPSIHHHFARKDDLVAEVTARYRRGFLASVEAIEAATATGRLTAYAGLFAETASEDLMCLCGAITTDWVDVGDATRAEVEGFFADQITWLGRQIAEGVTAGEFRQDIDVGQAAQVFLASLEGSVLLSRAGQPSNVASVIGGAQLHLLSSPGVVS